ncbi:carbohydrate ABC transporter permease [Alicyclobacillus fastidiosus]|uniref:Carbohydrate ABC transporter permease n=1 Tax=Alicyclobacillus fastidiosus TaxID=392011 RepID=A0ABV5A8U1_9BACL|nr:carbohydrate ABC transporter permease [Alicyclobacillus fastidiosus]WEH10663.1 carbohydrate ABC transporter permease [Alicyclobacillus fastidiosus]
MKVKIFDISLNIVVWIGGILVVIPFLWMMISSFKTQGQIFQSPFSLPRGLNLHNYSSLFTQWPYLEWYRNSVMVAVILTGLTVFFSTLAGYGFSKYQFKGKSWMFAIVIMSLSIPFQSILIPLYSEMAEMHIANSYVSLIIPFIAPPVGIFLMRQFIYSVPDELLDAGRIDGCSEFTLYLRIVLPLLKPAMGALAIITFVSTWGNFLWPLVMLNDSSKFTLPLGLYSLLSDASNGGNAQYGQMLAGAALASVPPVVLFLFMQRAFVNGMTMGGVKDD